MRITTRRSVRSAIGCAAALAYAAFAGVAFADVRLPAILGSNMVVQAETDAPFWGWADPGEVVTVEPGWSGAEVVQVTANDSGAWSCTIATPEAGGPYTIGVRGDNTIELTNVLVGEVWLASGQSNMEWPMRSTKNAKAEIAGATDSKIRLFLVQNAIAPSPQDDCKGRWVVCSPETVPAFSAVAYFFGRDLRAALDVPVGLIGAEWGGTPAESWTSAEGLARFPQFAAGLELMRTLRENPDALEAQYQQELAAWKAKYAKAEQMHWTKAGFDDSGWGTLEQPGNWSSPDLKGFDGTVWCRKTIEIPQAWVGRELALELGPIDDQDETFFNGVSVGEMRGVNQWNVARRYTIPAKLVKAGPAVVAVSVIDTGGLGGMHGEAAQMFIAPRGHSESDKVSLAGAWSYRKGASAKDIPAQPQRRAMNAHTPSALFNGMIAPVHPFAIRGAIWYQGESNRSRAYEYRSLFASMIEDWRRTWEYDFPFYYVQIAPYTYNGDSGQAAELREAQLMALSLPNTGMAVTMDIGNPRDIHPRNKQDVGNRLARWALAKTYHQPDIVYSGPLYRDVTVSGSQAIVRFDHAEGLSARGGLLKGFEIAGEDKVWRAAGALIDGETVVLSAYGITKPVAVRYGWDDDDEPNLFNGEGLPASPFRTDSWKRVTQP
ncbi:MAG: sialate O-acetylesterase [Planctomycetota bacterium]|nr:sialate O-acetylesterase [Planctomycetota bacterium]